MTWDPNQPRNKIGEWTADGSGEKPRDARLTNIKASMSRSEYETYIKRESQRLMMLAQVNRRQLLKK
jgi:hypothetical protein